jgi:hypothetical protein
MSTNSVKQYPAIRALAFQPITLLNCTGKRGHFEWGIRPFRSLILALSEASFPNDLRHSFLCHPALT